MSTLTTEQVQAINENSNLILVKAGAGTGKTEILTRRVIRLLKDDPNLSIQDMAIITFTNKATENLISRLKEYLYQYWKNEKDPKQKQRFRYELEGLNTASVSTIHSFCKEILDFSGPVSLNDFSYSPCFRISSMALSRAIDDALEQWLEKKQRENKQIQHLTIMPVHELKKQVKKAYTMIRSKGLDFDAVVEKTRIQMLLEVGDTPRKLKVELIEILTSIKYLHNKYKLQSLDTDDLLEYCAKTLTRREDIKEQIKKKYKHLFIDEFQDTSAYQTEIIKSICPGDQTGPKLFVVGDIKQSIYKFRGADLDSYSSIEEWIESNGKVLHLRTNFRSTPELVMFVNQVFDKISKDENKKYDFYPESLRPRIKQDNIDISKAHDWILAPNSSRQSNCLVEFLKKQMQNNVELNKFTILFRSNYEVVEYSKILKEAKVPHKIIGGGDLFNQQEVVDIYKLVNFIIHQDSQIRREEALQTIYFQSDTKLFQTFLNSIENIHFEKMTPAQSLDFIYKKIRIKDTGDLNRKQINANLNKLKELTRRITQNENLNLYHFQDWLLSMISSHHDEPQADIKPDDEGDKCVTLMTIHKSKGLEFPIVILPELDKQYTQAVLRPNIIYDENTGLEISYKQYYGENKNSTTFPSAKYGEKVVKLEKEHYSEELRILYVALTRAEEKLILIGDQECPPSRICFQNWLLK